VIGHFSQLLQIFHLEGLDVNRQGDFSQIGEQRLLERNSERAEVAGMLGLGIDADRPPGLGALPPRQREHLGEGRYLEAAVERRIAERQPLPGA